MYFNLCWLLKAPEMLRGDVVGPPADIWSIGVLTYIMWVLSIATLSLKLNGDYSDFTLILNVWFCAFCVTCSLVSNLMSAGIFESLQLFCLMNFVFTFQKLSEACELSVSVIMFDMNAILVCNSKLLSCCTPFRLSGRLPFTENDPAETEARIQAAKFDLSKLYQNVSQSASLFLKKILCSYPWWVKNIWAVCVNLKKPVKSHILPKIHRKTFYFA